MKKAPWRSQPIAALNWGCFIVANTKRNRYSGKDTLVGKQDGAFVTSFLGFRRNFAAGGQLLVNFANTLVWEFTGNRNNLAISNVTLDMVQPLLRGAFRDVRLETLTQAERDVL